MYQTYEQTSVETGEGIEAVLSELGEGSDYTPPRWWPQYRPKEA